MLFAEVSEAIWLAIIGLVTMIVKDYLDRRRLKDATKGTNAKVDEVSKQATAAKAEAVKVKEVLETVTADHGGKLDAMADNVERIEKATNSVVKQLVDKAGEAGVDRGVNEERARAGNEERIRADERSKVADVTASVVAPIAAAVAEVHEVVVEVKQAMTDVKKQPPKEG